ncbi:MAG: RagB/SusD family nutrient uptake outer membrane protein [Gemmatimonadetes bacterium]|nr:RagB/SusD family nutrient uptake outer membrane protein [Gemmatimonadota bacterium]
MRTRMLLGAVVVALLGTGCGDLTLTDPNQRTSGTFWRDQTDALTAMNAVYNELLQQNGQFGYSWFFSQDARADVGISYSPDNQIANMLLTVFSSYDYSRNVDVWKWPLAGIFRANLVIANVPNIESMTQAMRDRIVGEAKFLRAYFYYELAGTHCTAPIILEPVAATDRPANAPLSDVYKQIEADLTAAAAALPASYSATADKGRATRGAALALLGLAQLDQKKWSEGAANFQKVIESGTYKLAPTFKENFTLSGNNNVESIFDIQFGDASVAAQGIRGNGAARLVGPSGVGFADVQPTQFMFDQFFTEGSWPNNPDPRLEYTIYWNKPGGMDVFGTPFATRYPTGFKFADINHTWFWKKNQNYEAGMTVYGANGFNQPINYHILRYATVLLLQAEALTETGQTAQAAALVNQVRARVGLAPISTALSQTAMRAAVEHEQMVELAWEQQRYTYLKRHGLLNKAYMIQHDPKFFYWVDGKSECLPIPQAELDMNPNMKQNPGW